MVEVATVVEDMQDDSVDKGRFRLGEISRCSVSVISGGSTCIFAFTTALILGDKGAKSGFSCMVVTIFSRVCDVRCGSLPLLLESAESSDSDNFRMRFRRDGILKTLVSSELASESTELDRDGTPLDRVGATLMKGTIVFSGCGGQHRVSLAHTLQLRFSSRFPSGIVAAHRENTDSS